MSLARLRLAFAALLFIASSVSAAISEIQINQAIGTQKNGARKFVAGKDTVVRAFLTEPTAISHASTSARIIRDGTTVTTLSPSGVDGARATVVDFLCPSRSDCEEWAAGAYTFDVRVNGEFQSTAGVDYRFVKRAPLRVLALPVVANYGGTIVPVTDDRWKTFGDYIRKTYPLAPEDFVWEIRDALDASDSSFDLETDDGQRNLWEALAKLIPPHCADNPGIDGCFHQVFGFIMDRPKGYPNGTLQGYTFGKPANVGVVRDEDAPATVAHEIGHTFGLGDTYDGGSFNCPVNPAPDEFSGKDFDTGEEGTKCTAGRTALQGVGGTLIPASHHPYEVGGRGALGDSAEYMGSGGAQAQFWTTQDAWDHLFDKFAPSTVNAASVGARATARFIQCFGTVTQAPATAADVHVDPCWTYDDDAGAIPNTTGKYMMAAVDAAGMRLSSAALNPDFTPVAPKGTAPRVYPLSPFVEEMPLPAGAARLQFLYDGRVIREVPISRNAPTVTAVAPELQGTVAAKTTISWQAADADGDPLSFEILFNPDVTRSDSEWEVIVRDVTTRSLAVDFGALAGGANAQIAVVATDGVNVGEGLSARFVVAPKPPDVFIDAEADVVVPAGAELVLDSEVLDLQDDWLDDPSLVWSSSLAGTIGSGPTLVTDRLAPGRHEITLTATNSAGLKGSDRVTVHVVKSDRRRAVRR